MQKEYVVVARYPTSFQLGNLLDTPVECSCRTNGVSTRKIEPFDTLLAAVSSYNNSIPSQRDHFFNQPLP